MPVVLNKLSHVAMMMHHERHHTQEDNTRAKTHCNIKDEKISHFQYQWAEIFYTCWGWAGLPYHMTGFGYNTKSKPVLKRYDEQNCIPLLLVLLGCCTLFSLCSFSSNGSTDAESIAVWGKRDIRLPSSDTSCLCLTRCSLKMSTYQKSLLFCNSVNGW